MFLQLPFMQATSREGKEAGIELIQPPANSKPGDRAYFEGSEFESVFPSYQYPAYTDDHCEGVMPLPQLNPKKKIFETIQPGKCLIMSLCDMIGDGSDHNRFYHPGF